MESLGIEGPAPDRPSATKEALEGVATIFLWNIGHFLLAIALTAFYVGIYLLMFYAPLAMIYGIVLIVRAWRGGEIARAKGMMVAVAITVLLSSACTGSVLGKW